jgi:serine/threonine protein kinase
MLLVFQVSHLREEVRVLRTLACQAGFPDFFGCFQDAFRVYMVSEFVPGGELFSQLRVQPR